LLRRHENLIKSGGISKQELDDSRAAASATAARVTELASQVEVYHLPERKKKIEAQQAVVKAAEARVAQARWELEQKRIQAPAAGLVYDTLFRQGEWVPAGSPVVQMLPPGNVKIRFFVPETRIGGIRLGSRVVVQVDGRAEPVQASISYVAANAEYTPPIIYSNETRSKLVFMVEARPELEIAPSLHPGQPVSVSLP
jgi:HlyD family secretion protein